MSNYASQISSAILRGHCQICLTTDTSKSEGALGGGEIHHRLPSLFKGQRFYEAVKNLCRGAPCGLPRIGRGQAPPLQGEPF